ncbi:hypothetical protein [Streptomyces sp. NPDC057052]|uniref:hypothetical protein n=1 Tax=Streptomyces sp. NPDC057052 TaxID=3346010 RepID=UPI003643064D
MLSDVLISLFSFRQDDQVGACEAALDRLGEAAGHVDAVVPCNGVMAGDHDIHWVPAVAPEPITLPFPVATSGAANSVVVPARTWS